MNDLPGGTVRRTSTGYRLVLYRWDETGQAERTGTARPARRDSGTGYRFVLPLSGELIVVHEGREERLRPGTGGLVPPGTPPRTGRDGPARAFALTIPAHEVDARLDPMPALPAALDLTAGLGRVVAGMVRAVDAERAALSRPQFDAACDRITELLCMLAAAEGARPAAPGHLAEVEAVARRYVREHATDPGLTGAAMAQDLGWSLRQVQLALQRAGTTPRRLIREERLRLVRDRLRNPGDRHVSITDLAHASGFSSASALSTAFRQRFGVSPSELRHAAGPRRGGRALDAPLGSRAQGRDTAEAVSPN